MICLLLTGSVVPLTDEQNVHTILGVLLCFRHIIPQLGESNEGEHTMRGSFGRRQSTAKENRNAEDAVDEKHLLEV